MTQTELLVLVILSNFLELYKLNNTTNQNVHTVITFTRPVKSLQPNMQTKLQN